PDAGPYLREQLNLAPGTPVDLRCFADPPTGEKPTVSLINLVKVAIYGSPKRCLPLQGIYDALMYRFRYFRESPGGPWTRSIRHLLSLKAVFVKVNRPVTDPGKGVYWQLDITQGEGDKRVRKRMYKGNPPVLSTEDDE
ncbi:fork head domain-containing protein, partial [Favolaschia claudopus]